MIQKSVSLKYEPSTEQFWAAHQRFFGQLLLNSKVDAVILHEKGFELKPFWQ